VLVAAGGDTGIDACARLRPELVFLDILLPGARWPEVLAQLLAADPVVLMVAQSSHLDEAIDALGRGAEGIVREPVDEAQLRAAVTRALDQVSVLRERRHRRARERWLHLGASPALRELARRIEQLATSNSSAVLLIGESGTGKGRVAAAMHALSSRRERPLVGVHCLRDDPGALVGELFGREHAAAGESMERRTGLVQIADGGTLFLDEVAALEPGIQEKLLRLLETRSFRRVGGASEQVADVRLIAATSRDLAGEVSAGTFREDLYYRLSAGTIHLPPLRARARDDVADVIRRIVGELHLEIPGAPLEVSDAAMEELVRRPWPGNVRELRSVLESALISARGAPRLDLAHLMVGHGALGDGAAGHVPRSLSEVERSHIERTLRAHRANRTRAARELGISRATLINKIKAYGLGDWRSERVLERYGKVDLEA